jgi:hypothetical protein
VARCSELAVVVVWFLSNSRLWWSDFVYVLDSGEKMMKMIQKLERCIKGNTVTLYSIFFNMTSAVIWPNTLLRDFFVSFIAALKVLTCANKCRFLSCLVFVDEKDFVDSTRVWFLICSMLLRVSAWCFWYMRYSPGKTSTSLQRSITYHQAPNLMTEEGKKSLSCMATVLATRAVENRSCSKRWKHKSIQGIQEQRWNGQKLVCSTLF